MKKRRILLPYLMVLKSKYCVHIMLLTAALMNVSHVSAQAAIVQKDSIYINSSSRGGSASQLFHQGLVAYIDKDYSSAYKNWVQSANKGHAKAFFNLAGMWSQGLVPGNRADSSKAKRYYSMASNSGYFPAKNHIAGKTLTKPAAKTTSQSLVVKTNIPERSVVKQTAVKIKPEKVSPSKNKPHWSIQIFASNNINQLKEFNRANRISSKTEILKENINGAIWYKLVYGQYASHDEAARARDNLPGSLKVASPWVREVN